MRISVIQSDRGYRVDACDYYILIDGQVTQLHCVTADEEGGYVVAYRDAAIIAGYPCMEVYRGKVRVLRPAPLVSNTRH